MGRVIVVGSVNQDITVTVDRFPQPGETLSGTSTTYRLGGKVANQAAAAAHGGATTLFVGRVGGDAAGITLREELRAHGVDVSALRTDEEVTTGIAFITVSAAGENTIILDAGANSRVTGEQAAAAVELAPDDVVILQGEIPPAVNEAVIAWAHAAGARIVLNLAPVYPISAETLAAADILVVNESECGLILGTPAPQTAEEALTAAAVLRERGTACVLVTLGADGAVRSSDEGAAHVPALELGRVVDTTGAGDATVGVLAAALAMGRGFPEAVDAGMRAGSTAVLAAGAASSYADITPVAPRTSRDRS